MWLPGRTSRMESTGARMTRPETVGGSCTSGNTKSAGLAHDLRNTLTCIRGYAQLLLSGPSEELKVKALSMIESEAGRCCGLLDGMFSPETVLKLSPDLTDVKRAVSDVCSLVRGEAALRGVALSCKIEQELPAASTPEEDARRVLLEVVRNACRATPADGRVDVWARTCNLDGRTPSIEVNVSGSGQGIPKNMLAAPSEPSDPTSSPGQGLAVSQALVSRRGGTLVVKSAEGTGTTFTLRLPAQA